MPGTKPHTTGMFADTLYEKIYGAWKDWLDDLPDTEKPEIPSPQPAHVSGERSGR